MELNKESFEWIKGAGNLPKDRLLKVVAKTTAPTLHPEDPNYPIRIFAETELMRNAASLVGRPVGRNHEPLPIFGAYAVDSEWNDAEKQLEALLFVPSEDVQKVKDKLIKECSIEYTWRDETKTDEGTKFNGLGITRIDLVEGLKPGDPNAIVSLFETVEKHGVILAEISLDESAVPPETGTPKTTAERAKDHFKISDEDWKALSPEAQKAKTDALPPTGTGRKEADRIVELEGAVTRLTETVEKYKTEQSSKIAEAVKEAKESVIKKVEAQLPGIFIQRQGAGGLARLTQNIKRVLREAREE